MAERLACDAGLRVLVVDRRQHIAGNAYDCLDHAGIRTHRYGPHIFHTNAAKIVAYLSRFTAWRPYEHRVLAEVDGRMFPIPINRTTLNRLYGADLQSDEEVAAFLAARAEARPRIRTSEDVVVSTVGRELYETFYSGYTRKQWGMDPSELDKSVAGRVTARQSEDDRYFTDDFQGMPTDGYAALFERMLVRPNIDVALGVDYRHVKESIAFDWLVFTGAIDEFFDCRFGRLAYRSLRFEHKTFAVERYQRAAVINYPSAAVPYTRSTEHKHLTGQCSDRTTVTWEYPSAYGDPFYPVPNAVNRALYQKYDALARRLPRVAFVGRLATYRYLNMDQVVGQALATYNRLRSDLV